MVVETRLPQPLVISVPDGLRVVVDSHREIGQRALAIREFGDLVMVDRHALTERPVPGHLAQLVGVVGMAVRAAVLPRDDGCDHLTFARRQPAAVVGAKQRK